MELNVRFQNERMRFGDCGIASAIPVGESVSLAADSGFDGGFDGRAPLTIKGDYDPEELVSGMTYELDGRFRNYTNPKSGQADKQFHFWSFRPVAVHDREGVIAYLAEAGKGNGFGPASARAAWEKWGVDAVRTIRENPSKLHDLLPRLSRDKINNMVDRLVAQLETESTNIDLCNLFNRRGFPKKLPRQCVKEWGNRAPGIIQRDPYRLIAFRGCGWERCDKLHLELGLPRYRLRRQTLRAWHEISNDSDGSTWHPLPRAVAAVRSLGSSTDPDRAIELGVRLGRKTPGHYGALTTIRTDGPKGMISEFGRFEWVAEAKKAQQEVELARHICTAMQEPKQQSLGGKMKYKSMWPDIETVMVDEHQKQALRQCLQGPIGILGGSPGTGKTYTVAQLVKAALESGKVQRHEIAVGSPTGKAGVRVSENLQACQVPVRAHTWHSLLGIEIENGRMGFRHNEFNPWKYKIIIGDESSMPDVPLMGAAFAARPRNCHVLLSGDINQLSPIGHGAPLRDMIAAGLPYGELTEIKRNSGGIVEACAAIRDGLPWEPSTNLVMCHETSPEGQIDRMERVIDKARGQGFDPVWDVQVIIALNNNSQVSRKPLNEHLQKYLNGNAAPTHSIFRLGDKVVCGSNGYLTMLDSDGSVSLEMLNQDGQVYVANGEIGRVVAIEERRLIVDLQGPYRQVAAPLSKPSKSDGSDDEEASSGCVFELAYALTGHKLQGSDAPVCITMLDEYAGARRVCDRSWLYTAISRAKEFNYLVGRKSTADAMCRRNFITQRKTFLREQILLQQGELILEMI